MPSTWQAIAAFVVNNAFGIQSANKIVERTTVLAASRLQHYLGGSRTNGVFSATYVDWPDYIDIELDGTDMGGMTVEAKVEVMTTNVATAVTPKVRNITDGTDAVVGTTFNADTNWNKQTLTFTPVAGLKVYRLQLTGSNNTNQILGGPSYVQVYA